jgi:TatA/E family protein of Tat protein translocase
VINLLQSLCQISSGFQKDWSSTFLFPKKNLTLQRERKRKLESYANINHTAQWFERWDSKMAWDDPVVWILIVGAVILLFGSNKIPQIARSLGAARKEFDVARKGLSTAINSEINAVSAPPGMSPTTPPTDQNVSPITDQGASPLEDDPLLVAARNEGIDTRGKTRSEIAAELASKVKD